MNMNRNQKITILCGVSASGKSTLAAEMASNTNSVIISRDNIRAMLYGYTDSNIHSYYTHPDMKSREKEVTKVSDIIIRKALREGKDVIADNTHLRSSYVNSYKNFGVKLYLSPVYIMLDRAFERDETRIKKVGKDIIGKQMSQFQKLATQFERIFEELDEFNESIDYAYNCCQKAAYDPDKANCYIFDIDGTLAHRGTRSAYDYSKVLNDSIDLSVGALSVLVGLDTNLIICSGREDSCEIDTRIWLDNMQIPYTSLHMRATGDHRKDWIVKAEMWEQIQAKYNILGMVDDRAQVVDFARRLGYKVFQVDESESNL